MKRSTATTIFGLLFVFALPLYAEIEKNVSASTDAASSSEVAVSTPSIRNQVTPAVSLSTGTGDRILEKVSVDDTGTRLMILMHFSKQVDCFLFERHDPPSIFVQFLSTPVFTAGPPIQVVGIDPLSEVRYGYASFQDAAVADKSKQERFPVDYLELRLTRPVFYSIQQEGWVVVIGLDRTAAKVEVPELDFRFNAAKYEGAAHLPPNPRANDFVAIAQANSRLLSIARYEAELAKKRVFEARRALLPSVTGRMAATRGKELNPFPDEDIEGFETTTFKRDEYGVQVAHPLFQSGKLSNAYRQAKLNRQMALENVRKQAQDLTYEVKKAHITILKNQTTLRIRRELVAQGEIIKDMAKKKFDLKLAARSEVLNVVAQADQATYQMASDEQDVSLSRLVLISLLNQSDPISDPVAGALSFSKLSFNVESIIAWAQEHRPDVRIARINSELARYNWKSARGENNIKIDATGFYGRAGASFAEENRDFEMRETWNAGLKVSYPFWGNTLRGNVSKEKAPPDLGQWFVVESEQKSLELGLLDAMPTVSNARQAQLQYEKAQAELVEAARKAEYEVREAYYNLEKAARQIKAVREDITFRQKDLEITREKVKLGLAELSQQMTAENAHAQAQVQEQDALGAYNIALANMDRVAGAEVVRE
ncbi:MAG: TolC family protein [Elusimicrobia bacterium]|nr:TolC family protein [Candidatus Obscuribacterium magneticum]